MTDPTKPFGLRDIKLTTMDGMEQVDLPSSMTLSFKERVMTGEFTGDDELQGVVTIPIGVEGSFESGGIPLEAYALMSGHTFTDGVGSQTLEGDSGSFPYFKIYGKAVDDEGGDIHCKILKAKLTSALEGEFKYGQFFMTKASFIGVKVDGKAFEFVANDEEAPLPSS